MLVIPPVIFTIIPNATSGTRIREMSMSVIVFFQNVGVMLGSVVLASAFNLSGGSWIVSSYFLAFIGLLAIALATVFALLNRRREP